MAEDRLLSGNFQLYPDGNSHCKVILTTKYLSYKKKSGAFCSGKPRWVIIEVKDIIGAKVFKSRNVDVAAYIQIFAYPLRLYFSGKRGRQRVKLVFRIHESADREQNLKIGEQWVRCLHWLIRCPSMDSHAILGKRLLPSVRKLLVFVNPFGGQGKAIKIFHNKVEPVLKEADIEYKVVITEYAGHAQEITEQLKVNEWDGILICSGDGVVFEVINGLLHQLDWSKAISLPLGVIPTGSGNALCASALYQSGEPLDVTSAVVAVARGYTRELDLATIVTPTKTLHTFLGIGWGIISDCDIESEKYRWMGEFRFSFGGFIRILSLRTYHGRLSYLPLSDKPETPTGTMSPMNTNSSLLNGHVSNGGHTINGRFCNRNSVGVVKPVPPRDDESANPQTVDFILGGNEGFSQSRENLVDNSDDNDDTELVISSRFTGSPSFIPPDTEQHNSWVNNSLQLQAQPFNGHIAGPENDLLAPLDKPVPSNWAVVEGEFIMACPFYNSHLNFEMMGPPSSCLNDGIIYIVCVKAPVSKRNLLKMMGELQDGSFVKNPHVQVYRTRAFRLEPNQNEQGTLTADGECIEYTAIQGQIHKGLARVMCVRKEFDTRF